jgi:hypothetical protein
MNTFNIGNIILNTIIIIIIVLIGILSAKKTAIKQKTTIIYYVFFTHLLFSILYYIFALYNTADANGYYNRAIEQTSLFDSFETGTKAIVFISYIFVKFLSFSKLSLFLLFGFFGFIGFIYFIRQLEANTIKVFGIPTTFLIIFLPGFHFWTAALGKDSIIFMAIILFFYGIKNTLQNKLMVILSFLIITSIRPYLSLFILLSIFLAILTTKFKRINKSFLSLFLISIVVFVLILPFTKDFLNLDSFDINNLVNRSEYYNEQGSKQLSNTTSYVDVSDYGVLNKMFMYFFRPLFFDARSIMQFLASLENLFLLVFLIKWLISIRFKFITWLRIINITEKTMFYFAVIGWFTMALSMYNLGLASRQKYMFIPILLILFSKKLQFRK